MAQIQCKARVGIGVGTSAPLTARAGLSATVSVAVATAVPVRRKAMITATAGVGVSSVPFIHRVALLKSRVAWQIITTSTIRGDEPATTKERFLVDGVLLNTFAYNIESLTGRLRVPQVRTKNVSIPNRHGAVYTPHKFYEVNEIALPMWVIGGNPDGSIPDPGTSRRELFFDNIEKLASVFSKRTGLLHLKHVRADGRVRYADGEVTEVIDFSTSGMNPLAQLAVSLQIPDVFWYDAYVDFGETTQNPELPYLLHVVNLAGSSAPIEDAEYEIVGPVTNLEAESYHNGGPLNNSIWFRYNSEVPSGQKLYVNCIDWTLRGEGGLIPDYKSFTHGGSARWMVLYPGPEFTAPQVRFNGSNTGASTQFRVNARRKYILG